MESSEAAFRPLNVKDALSYLDRVKVTFADQAEVYDRFLTIMKDFKSQGIDTPGVIDRVSSLFRGHPSLIQGFNTFLPPGYRIECSVSAPSEAGASNTITVTTPMGVTTRTQDVTGVEAREFVKTNPQALEAAPAPTEEAVLPASTVASTSAQPLESAPVVNATTQPPPQAAPPTAVSPLSKPHLPPLPDPASTQFQPPRLDESQRGASIARPSAGPPPPQRAATRVNPDPDYSAHPSRAKQNERISENDQQTPVMEFNHAINYVNKIKNRFTDDPETYKTFLEILQTYQKETRPIQEVYTQVTALFHSAPDLLDEFKAFLPDTTDSAAAAPVVIPTYGAGRKKAPAQTNSAKKNAVEEKKKRAAPGMGERAKAKKAKTAHAQIIDSPPVAAPLLPKVDRNSNFDRQNHEPIQSAYQHTQPYGAPPPGFPGAPRMQSAYDSYLANHRAPTLVQSEEFGFFDRVKKYLDDRATYTEFLKLLNLFTQEIIDVATLLEKSLLFIGGNDDLVGAFKDLVGWDPVKDGRIEGEDWIIDNEPVLERPKVELHLMKSFGPSYRKLPDSEIDLACSGRDSLEWSVLNDEWVAFATSASEGSGAHRKNVYEDALYNSEQERHWYSFQIESNLRTIAHFEPIAARIVRMDAMERMHYRMEEGLGGSSPSIYKRVIKKVYGKDQGNEILQAIYDNPTVAVPIVLARLKQKDEEWKRALREWNKVWREVDAKNFYRALDHQGVNFKSLDKKQTMATKSVTAEIDTLRRDKTQKRIDVDLSLPPARPLHQFELGFSDRDVLFDVLKLTFSYLDRDQSGFSAPERVRVEAFIRLFIPLLLGVPHSEMELNLAQLDEKLDIEGDVVEEEPEHEVESDPENASDAESVEPADHSDGGSSTGKRNGVNRRGGAADLRKRLLTHVATTTGRGSPKKPSSRAPSPAEDEEDASLAAAADLDEQAWLHLEEGSAGDVIDDATLPRRFNFFASSSFYCLARMIHTLYSRLSSFKELARVLAEKEIARRLSPMAVELGLANPVPIIDNGDNPFRHYYEHALNLAEKLFDGEIDQPTYEEHLRYMLGIKAFPLFTIDKVIGTLIKHIHAINGDGRCHDLVALLEKDRARDSITPRQQIAYRLEAETIIGADDNLYRLEWIPESKILSLQLLSKEDLTLDEPHPSASKLLQSWVASFAAAVDTGAENTALKAPLLNRNRMASLAATDDAQEIDAQGVERNGIEAAANRAALDAGLSTPTSTKSKSKQVSPVDPENATKRQERFDEWLDTTAKKGAGGSVTPDVAMD